MRSLYSMHYFHSGERFAGYIYRQPRRRRFSSGYRMRISSASAFSPLSPLLLFADPRSHCSPVRPMPRYHYQQYPRRNGKVDQPLSSTYTILFLFRAEYILHFGRRTLRQCTLNSRSHHKPLPTPVSSPFTERTVIRHFLLAAILDGQYSLLTPSAFGTPSIFRRPHRAQIVHQGLTDC